MSSKAQRLSPPEKGFATSPSSAVDRMYIALRVRQYTIDAEDKRHMRRLYPNIVFDWKKITRQLAEKRFQ